MAEQNLTYPVENPATGEKKGPSTSCRMQMCSAYSAPLMKVSSRGLAPRCPSAAPNLKKPGLKLAGNDPYVLLGTDDVAATAKAAWHPRSCE